MWQPAEAFTPMLQADAVTAATMGPPSYSDSDNATPAGSYDVVVIGAGGGGLAAAARLSRAGKKVLVLEQHSRVGGYMTSFTRNGYTFEASLHHFDGLDKKYGMMYPVMQKLGILHKIHPLRLEKAYNLAYPDGKIYTVPADADDCVRYLCNLFPAERAGIRNFFRLLKRMATAIRISTAVSNGRPLEAVRAWLSNPFFMVGLGKYADASAYALLGDFFTDEKLKGIIYWLAGYGCSSPEQTNATMLLGMLADYHFGGFYHFEGGSASVAQALAEVIREHGGTIKTNTAATKILIANGKATGVRTATGELYKCDYVVSNANAPDTVNKLVGRENLPADFLQKLDALTLGISAFVVYLGVDTDYTDIFNGAHSLAYNTHYLPPPDFNPIQDIDPETSLYVILNLSVIDSTVAPPGKNTLVLATGSGYGYNDAWESAGGHDAYLQCKEEAAQRLISRAENYLPDLSRHIEVMEIATPLTMAHYTLNPGGAIMGWQSDFNADPASLRERLPQQTPIANLFLAGAWTAMGGQSSVLASGVSAAEKILALAKHGDPRQ